MTNSAETFSPGEFLKDELEARNWSQVEFAEIIGRPVRLVNELIAGKKSITPETATQLGASLGTSAELWMNLESQYQLSKVQRKDDAIQRKAKLYATIPVREMIRRNWIGGSEEITVLEHQFKTFYGLSSLEDVPSLAHAAKKTAYENVSMPQWAWLFRAKHMAEGVVAAKYDKKLLIGALPQLQRLLSEADELRHIPKLLSACGVRFVLVEALPGSSIDGACMWIGNDQPVIAMSARLDRIDNFWFVLRHELEHLIQEHGKDRNLMVDENVTESSESNVLADELVANRAAAAFCVSDSELSGYMARVNPYYFSKDKVLGFSRRIGVHPGVVVGRLQKELASRGYPEPYKYLREYLVKVRHIVMPAAAVDGWGTVYPTH